MTTSETSDLTYNPYDPETVLNPHPLFKRMRDEAPIYYNEELDFYAISRFEDIERTLVDRDTFSSKRGVTLDLLKSGYVFPSGTVIFEDPPEHGIHRALISRTFTPRRISGLEDEIRSVCIEALDPLVGSGGFDLVRDYSALVPMRVIGMLLGIPEADQVAIRDHFLDQRKTQDQENPLAGHEFEEYIDWRIDHPSDDIMTQLLNSEFEDEHGVTRRLTRDELLMFVSNIAAAGNETTRTMIAWSGRLLAEYPEQRQVVVDDRSLLTNAIEEILRYEPNTSQNCRWVARDTQFYGTHVPEGSILATLTPAGNRDERHFEDPDRFDVQRKIDHHLSFGFGAHYCLGQALARLELRVALGELLERFPVWDADLDAAQFMFYPDNRGYDSLPISVP